MSESNESSSPGSETGKGNYSFSKEVKLRNGETVILPTFHVEKMRLFTGSPVSGIETFRDSDETTIGAGVYLTSQKDVARGYALVRGHRHPAMPTLYEVEIADMDILDLTTRIGVESFAKFWKQQLIDWKLRRLPAIEVRNEMVREIYKEKVQRVLELINKDRVTYLKDLTWGFGGLVRDVLIQQAYDGLLGLEGGESGDGVTIGDHDSYVIFDPKSVKKINEESVAKSV